MPKLALPQFLHAISISGATENTWRNVVGAGYDTLPKIRALTVNTLAVIERESGVTVGFVNAEKVLNSLNSVRVSALLDKADKFLETEAPAVANPVNAADANVKIDVKGLNVVLTGTGPTDRTTLQNRIRAAGGVIQSSVSKNTHILIASETGTGKAKKAAALGTRVISYDEAF